MRAFWFCVAYLAACGSDTPGQLGSDARPRPDGAVGDPPIFASCVGRAYTPLPAQAWRHDVATPIITAAGAANHSAQDAIGSPGQDVNVPAKFTYGTVSKDLEDEDVEVFIDDCTGWQDLGAATTSADGRISVTVPDLAPGVYEVKFQVLGDQSMTTAYVWRLPAGTRVVLTDIDGTMTSSDSQLFMQMLDGSHVPVAYPGAVALTHAHADQGYVVVYLTGRPYWLTARTRAWLADLGFAPGPLHVTDSNEEAAPGEAGVGDFKKAWISALIAAGYPIDFAYGNATTDIYAYLGAGLAADLVWIIGANGGMQGTHAVIDSWEARVAEVTQLPAVDQPFVWP